MPDLLLSSIIIDNAIIIINYNDVIIVIITHLALKLLKDFKSAPGNEALELVKAGN